MEYDYITSCNASIAKEFIPLIRDYYEEHYGRSDEFLFPKQLYNHLRNHQWKEKIPRDFLERWIGMETTKYKLTDADMIDLQKIFTKLNISSSLISEIMSIQIRDTPSSLVKSFIIPFSKKQSSDSQEPMFPLPSQNFQGFKEWIMKKLDLISEMIK